VALFELGGFFPLVSVPSVTTARHPVAALVSVNPAKGRAGGTAVLFEIASGYGLIHSDVLEAIGGAVEFARECRFM
jgi:hypothetical protein